ncbi:MAG TPA: ABC transporter substrate-binding protein [Jiangellaceae bacterium]
MTISGRAKLAAGFSVGALLLTGCGGGGDTDQPEGGGSRSVTVHANSANSFQENFNPYSPTANIGIKGMVYEPLIAYSPMNPGEGTPWLAESMEFNADGTVVTLKLREGVTWSDGEAFDADDVVFTFEMMRDEPAVNTGALPIVSAVAKDELTVEVTFATPVFALEPTIGNVITVPEHVFSTESPTEFLNTDPVGTGPFTLGEFSGQLYTFVKNDAYWNADEIKVEEVRYPASTTQTFNTSLQNGEFDWSGGFVANIDEIFVSKDPEHNHYWYPGEGLVNLLVNHQTKPFDDVDLRQAISLAVDREQLSTTAMQGYTPPAHPTGLPLPAFESFMDPEYADAEFERNVDDANALLDQAGYAKGSDGIRVSPDGQRLSWDLTVPSDYVDWVSISKLLQEQLAEVGIEVKPQGVSFQSWVDARAAGTYSLTITGATAGSSPYFMYKSFMSSEYEQPAGTNVIANYNRWSDPETDAFLAEYAATSDQEARQEAIAGLEQIMVDELPVIPLLQSPNWFQYRTENWEGWPTEDDPYALPAPYQFPDSLLVISKLRPAG